VPEGVGPLCEETEFEVELEPRSLLPPPPHPVMKLMLNASTSIGKPLQRIFLLKRAGAKSKSAANVLAK